MIAELQASGKKFIIIGLIGAVALNVGGRFVGDNASIAYALSGASLIFHIIWSIGCMNYAKAKGQSGGLGFLLGFFLCWIGGLIVVFGLGDKTAQGAPGQMPPR